MLALNLPRTHLALAVYATYCIVMAWAEMTEDGASFAVYSAKLAKLFGPRAAKRITRPAHQSGSLITRLPDTNTTEEAATAPTPFERVSLVQVAVPVDTEKIVFLLTS